MRSRFLALGWRHRLIAVCFALAACVFLGLMATRGARAQGAGAQAVRSACPVGPSPTVPWLAANPRVLDCVLRECEDDPGAFARSRACVNAQSAAFARLRDTYAAEAHRLGRRAPRAAPPPAPGAPRRPLPQGPSTPVARTHRL